MSATITDITVNIDKQIAELNLEIQSLEDARSHLTDVKPAKRARKSSKARPHGTVKDHILTMSASNKSPKSIANRLGVNVNYVYTVLRDAA